MTLARRVTIVITVCAVTVFVGVAAKTLGAQQTPEQQLVQLERDWCTAVLRKDAALLGRLLADDYTGVTSRSITQTKADALADLSDKTSTVTSCVDTNVKARVYGNAAVVTGLGTRAGIYNGAAFEDRRFLWTDVFIRKDGRWQCVASQSTLVAAPQG
jgi:ketosteroid isomerase-like protein